MTPDQMVAEMDALGVRHARLEQIGAGRPVPAGLVVDGCGLAVLEEGPARPGGQLAAGPLTVVIYAPADWGREQDFTDDLDSHPGLTVPEAVAEIVRNL